MFDVSLKLIQEVNVFQNILIVTNPAGCAVEGDGQGMLIEKLQRTLFSATQGR